MLQTPFMATDWDPFGSDRILSWRLNTPWKAWGGADLWGLQAQALSTADANFPPLCSGIQEGQVRIGLCGTLSILRVSQLIATWESPCRSPNQAF